MVLEQVSSGQCWMWRGKLPLLCHHAKEHVCRTWNIHRVPWNSPITRALPCTKEEVVKGLILQLTTFC